MASPSIWDTKRKVSNKRVNASSSFTKRKEENEGGNNGRVTPSPSMPILVYNDYHDTL
jgi:hypothetical protein